MAKAPMNPPPDDETSEPPDDEGAEGEAGGAPPETSAKGGGMSPNASPEQQAQYEKFVLNGMLIIYDKKTNPIIVQQLRAGAKVDPVGTLAQVAVMVVSRLQQGAPDLGPDIMMQGGAELIEELAELSKTAGAHVYSDEEKQAALYKGADLMQAQMKQHGQIQPAQAKQNLDQLKQASQEGELDKIPGMKEVAAKGQAALKKAVPPQKGPPQGPQPTRARGMMPDANEQGA